VNVKRARNLVGRQLELEKNGTRREIDAGREDMDTNQLSILEMARSAELVDLGG
jgi:hypothetical protein